MMTQIRRHGFVAAISVVMALVAGSSAEGETTGSVPTAADGGARPNILFIMTDQQHAGMLSCAGNRHLRTPALDALAEAGTRFERAYAANPVCVPSRFALQTGRMPSAIGMGTNEVQLPVPRRICAESLGPLLRKAGYRCAYGGKDHTPTDLSKYMMANGYELLTRDERDGLARACADFLRQPHDRPFFLFASFINPHDICYMAINASIGTRPATRPASLLQDPDFERGFKVYDPKPGKHVVRGTIQPDPKLGGPVWGLAQWSSRYSLVGAAARRLDDGAVRFADEAKAVTFGPGDGPDRGLIFTLNGRGEYGERFRKPGEPWPHLLAEQRFAAHPAVVDLTRLRFRIEYRLRSSRAYTPEPEMPGQAAQFLAYITIQNLNRRSAGYGDYLWFGVPMYDSRYRVPKPHAARDTGTQRFIYSPAGSVYTDQSAHDGAWVTIDRDLVPLIREGLETAWRRGFLKESRDPADFCLGGFNIGWELPGTLDVEMQFRGLRIEAVTQ